MSIWSANKWVTGLGEGSAGAMEIFDGCCLWPKWIACGDPSWQSFGSLQPQIHNYFQDLNAPALSLLESKQASTRISFSHFIPYVELFPGMVQFRHVMGTEAIAAQVSSGVDIDRSLTIVINRCTRKQSRTHTCLGIRTSMWISRLTAPALCKQPGDMLRITKTPKPSTHTNLCFCGIKML